MRVEGFIQYSRYYLRYKKREFVLNTHALLIFLDVNQGGEFKASEQKSSLVGEYSRIEKFMYGNWPFTKGGGYLELTQR